ncbi:MAG: phospho-N-acetylmuramoyl-pentapeptide-transferase, partial [bacterium]|nr:phospho-N-acetylmuramoyl-pentapeptide-transferase [bacterium]
ISIILPTLLFARLDNIYTLLILLATIWGGAIGLWDDYLKVVKKKPKGLIARYKLIGQVSLGLAVGAALYFHPAFESVVGLSTVPFFKNFNIDFGIFYIPVIIFVITATSNGVNLADGLDGLAIGLVGISAIAWAGISYISGRVDFSDYLNIIYLPGAGEMTVYCSALIGASLGFLWYNTYPSQVFMGDTGSLALGCSMGTLAVLLHKELFLIIIGGMFVAETLSVILQVSYFKRTGGKRLFKMAPIHHHFELKGWHESQVVVRFWIIAILFVLLTLTMFKVR